MGASSQRTHDRLWATTFGGSDISLIVMTSQSTDPKSQAIGVTGPAGYLEAFLDGGGFAVTCQLDGTVSLLVA